MIELRPFEPEHAMMLPVRDIEKGMKNNEDFAKWAEENNTPGTSYSGFVGDTLLGCGGIKILWHGVGEAWVIFSPDVINHKIAVYRIVTEYLEKLIQDNNLYRVQAHVGCNFGAAINFVKNLGFEVEGKMRKFYPDGTDAFICALVR